MGGRLAAQHGPLECVEGCKTGRPLHHLGLKIWIDIAIEIRVVKADTAFDVFGQVAVCDAARTDRWLFSRGVDEAVIEPHAQPLADVAELVGFNECTALVGAGVKAKERLVVGHCAAPSQ